MRGLGWTPVASSTFFAGTSFDGRDWRHCSSARFAMTSSVHVSASLLTIAAAGRSFSEESLVTRDLAGVVLDLIAENGAALNEGVFDFESSRFPDGALETLSTLLLASYVFFADLDGVVVFARATVVLPREGVEAFDEVPLTFLPLLGVVNVVVVVEAGVEIFSRLDDPLGVDGVSLDAEALFDDGEDEISGVGHPAFSFDLVLSGFCVGEVVTDVVKRLRLPDKTLSRLIPFPLTPSNGGASPIAVEPAHRSGEAC